jgi:hypothetical protein
MLPIFHHEWKPILSLSIIVFALELYVCEPPAIPRQLQGAPDSPTQRQIEKMIAYQRMQQQSKEEQDSIMQSFRQLSFSSFPANVAPQKRSRSRSPSSGPPLKRVKYN